MSLLNKYTFGYQIESKLFQAIIHLIRMHNKNFIRNKLQDHLTNFLILNHLMKEIFILDIFVKRAPVAITSVRSTIKLESLKFS